MVKGFRWAMNDTQFQRWESLRKRGGRFFVLVWGLMAFGGSMFTFDVCLGVFRDHLPVLKSVDSFQTISDFGGGLFFGWLLWATSESQYRSALKRKFPAQQV